MFGKQVLITTVYKKNTVNNNFPKMKTEQKDLPGISLELSRHPVRQCRYQTDQFILQLMLIRVHPPALEPRLSRVTLVLHTALREDLVKAVASDKRLEQRLAFPQLEVTTGPTEEEVAFQSVSW